MRKLEDESKKLVKASEKQDELKQRAIKQNYLVPIQPLGSRLLVRTDEAASRVGQIIIPDSVKKRCVTGIIIGLGPEVNTASGLGLGKRILFGKYDGTPVEYKGQSNLVILSSDECRALIDLPVTDEFEISIGSGGDEP